MNIPKWNAKGCDDEVAGDEDEERRGVRVELESFKKQLRASNFRRLLLPLQTPFFFPNPYFSRAHFHRHRRSRCLPLGLCLALPPLTAVSSLSGGGRFRPLSSSEIGFFSVICDRIFRPTLRQNVAVFTTIEVEGSHENLRCH